MQIFGPLVWQVHLLKVAVPKLEPSGRAVDVQERAVIPAAPREAGAEGIKTDITNLRAAVRELQQGVVELADELDRR